MENAEAGLSLAASVISEQPIKQTHPKLVAAASELHNTGYHKLAKVLSMKLFSCTILLKFVCVFFVYYHPAGERCRLQRAAKRIEDSHSVPEREAHLRGRDFRQVLSGIARHGLSASSVVNIYVFLCFLRHSLNGLCART